MTSQPAPGNPLHSDQQLLVKALTSAANAVFITDDTGKIIWVNEGFCRLTGYSPEEAIGSTAARLHSGKQSPGFYASLWHTIQEGNVWQGEMVDQRKDGSTYTVDQIITPLFNEEGAVTHFIAIQQDITARKKEIDRERYLAYHDGLTGLPNRERFLDSQRQAISQAKRSHEMFATLFLDLDNFKPVNDTLGHHAGDQLLAAVAERLRAAVRQADIVARFGGDEFAILLTNLPDADVAAMLARKLIDILSRPFMLRGQKVNISASIGIAVFPDDGETPEALLMKADEAMYQAKCHGGNNYQIYNAALSSTP